MFWCSDPLVTYMNSLGYNVVRYPRTGIEPLQLLGREAGGLLRFLGWEAGKPTPLGKLDQLWVSPVEAPPTRPLDTGAGIETSETAKMRASIALNLLGPVLERIGVDVPKLKTAYDGARTLRFQFAATEIKGVDLLPLGDYLVKGELKETNPFISKFFFSAGAQVYVINEVLLTQSVTIAAETSDSVALDVNAKVVQTAVGADVKADLSSASSGLVTYKGPNWLAIGFKAVEIGVQDGLWTIRGLNPKLELGAVMAGGSAQLAVFNAGGLVEIVD